MLIFDRIFYRYVGTPCSSVVKCVKQRRDIGFRSFGTVETPVEECRQVGLSHGRHDQFKMYPFNYHVRPLSKSCSRIALGSCEPLEQVAQSHMPLPTHQEYLETLSKIYPPPFLPSFQF